MDHRKNQTVGKIAIACLTAIACLGFARAETADAPRPYDPAACKENAQEKLYVAFGRNVLAVPATGRRLAPPQSYFPADLKRRAPDPSELEGCPNNPQQ